MNILLATVLFLSSLIAALFGLGGGILYTPFQLWLGIPFKEAASVSLFLILITSFSATIVFRKKNIVDWSLAIMLEIPTTIGAFLGGIISHYFSESFLVTLLAIMILFAAFFMIFKFKSKIFSCSYDKNLNNSKWLWKRVWTNKTYYLDLRCVFPIMFTLGTLISMVGVSGGVLKIPVMLLIFGIPLPVAIGSSAFMVGLTAAAGFLGHAAIGHVNWFNILILIIPVFIGAQLGSRLSVHLKSKNLKKLYGWFLILVAIITFLRIYL